jgi:hypothetical protein
MQLATFGLIASFADPASGQRLPIRYLAYELDDASVSVLARSLVERVGDGGWARQLPPDLLASDLRPMLFARMAALAADGVTFAGAGARLLLERGVTAMWSGDQPVEALVTPLSRGEGLGVERPPQVDG